MTTAHVTAVRSVALRMPDLAAAVAFYTDVWHLEVVAQTPQSAYLRGTGADHHLLALHQGAVGGTPEIMFVTLRAASLDALHAIAHEVIAAGGRVLREVRVLDATEDPAGGFSVTVRDLDGRVIQVVFNDAQHNMALPRDATFDTRDTNPRRTALVIQAPANAAQQTLKDKPIRLAHVVLNSHAVDETQAFFSRVFGLKLIDRTAIMAFMNCNADHHSVAIGNSDNDALNHIAFVMPDVDAVMRGAGRMADAGLGIQWGPGRHGPGDNTFSYFIDPFGVVIEYTADIEQVGADYVTGYPDDWRWRSGRTDQWGIGKPPSPELKAAQQAVKFVES